jgi:Fe-S cluster biogenesis protein NfuA/nitrite reductase/ring-hydroxylating ferredoxin subunit
VLAPAPTPEELVERVGRLTGELERIDNDRARRTAEELIACVIELHGHGLERILAVVAESADPELADRLAADGVVASLMLIHGLYPVGLEQRVGEALDSVRPYMESHGGDVELLGIDDGVARIRLEGSCEGCPASASTLELAIKSALDEAAPDLEGLIVEGIGQAATSGTPEPGSLDLPVIGGSPNGDGAEPSPSTWTELHGVAGLAEGELTSAEVNGVALVVARVEGSLLAYRDRCTGCGQSFTAATLEDGTLICPSCERRFFLPRAGRSLDDERVLLEPVPLLAGAAGARVALPA